MMPRLRTLGAGALVALLGAACGTTYVDESLVSTTTVAAAPGDTEAPADNSVVGALERMAEAMDQLSTEIAEDSERAPELLDEIDRNWALVEPTIRADHPNDLFGFEQVVSMARTAVERRRPADASKAWKLLIDLSANLLKG